jgi:tryptophan synthase alpha chain
MTAVETNRIDATFEKLKNEGRKAFIAYLCAGDPDLDTCLKLVLALEEAGADIIELGLPFSDPLADGIVNQMAAQRALEAGTTMAGVMELIRRVREKSSIPLVLFTYLNPVYTYGFGRFHEEAAAAGADGVLLLDLPPDEARAHPEFSQTHGLKQIRLIAPTTSAERAAELVRSAEGFVYYICREGVTGIREDVPSDLEAQVQALQKVSPVPVCVGFGISKPEQVRAVASVADGVIVGSAIVKTIASTSAAEAPRVLREFTAGLVAGM